MALYGAPIWASRLDRRTTSLLIAAQRVMAVRVCRAYRTISHEVACALSGTLPWDLEAEVLASVYWRRTEARQRDERPAPLEVAYWRNTAQTVALATWKERLIRPAQRGAGARRLLDALQPVLKEWVRRRHGRLSYRLTQVLTGHGCFGGYLCRVAQRESSPACHQCGYADDTAQHALEACPAGDEARRCLVAVVGTDLSLPTIIVQMVGDERSWEAVASFSETIMLQREAEERERERDPLSDLLRRARPRRRANRARSPSPLGRPVVPDAGASDTQ